MGNGINSGPQSAPQSNLPLHLPITSKLQTHLGLHTSISDNSTPDLSTAGTFPFSGQDSPARKRFHALLVRLYDGLAMSASFRLTTPYPEVA